MDILLLAIGNPGSHYINTRHNLGVLVLWELIKLYDKNFIINSNHYEFEYNGKKIKALWNISYVNTTGNSLGLYMTKNNMKPHQLMVFFDNLEENFGSWKYSLGFGTFGHNGLKSIKNVLNSQSYHRVALGIGRPNDDDVSHYVLSNFSHNELKEIYNIAYDLYKNNILDKIIN